MFQFENEKFALVVANGENLSKQLLLIIIQKSDFILAADGGANYLKQIDIIPDAVIGDFDSVVTTSFPKDVQIISRPSQQINDLEKSIVYLIDSGYDNIVLTGVHGKRDDHFFAALQLMKQYNSKVTIFIVTDHSEIFMLTPGEHLLKMEQGTMVSLLGFDQAYNIWTENLQYPLRGENLFESSRGLSNVSISNEIKIEFDKGILLVFRNLT